jgi:hypothetical protein
MMRRFIVKRGKEAEVEEASMIELARNENERAVLGQSISKAGSSMRARTVISVPLKEEYGILASLSDDLQSSKGIASSLQKYE